MKIILIMLLIFLCTFYLIMYAKEKHDKQRECIKKYLAPKRKRRKYHW